MVKTSRDVLIGIRGRHAVHAAGVDLCDADRLRLAVDRTGPALARRVFDPDERSACADGTDPTATAVLFGIKESVIKLVGGLPPGAGFRDIRVGVSADGADGLVGGRLPVRLGGGLTGLTGLTGLAGAHRARIVAGGAPLPGHRVVLCWALALGPAAEEDRC